MFIKKDECLTVKEVIERNTGIKEEEFLKDMENPYLDGLQEAADCISNYIKNHKEPYIVIIGDYDCDGVTSTSIMYWMFIALGITPKTRVPRRFSEGYGLSEKIVDEIPEGDKLIVTVDNGIASYKAIEKAKSKGFTVVVTDHHLPPKDNNGDLILPPADVVFDPHVYPEKSEFVDYCGAGLAYRLAQVLLPNVNLVQLLVLASIGTVADVMPLIGANRTLVKRGLEAINKRQNVPGLNCLLGSLNLNDKHIDEDNYGFGIGPTVNASGRLYDDGAQKVINVFTSKSNNPKLTEMADNLVNINNVRKGIVRETMEKINMELESTDTTRPIVIYQEGIGEGIIGIIAGELTERYKVPSIVFTDAEKEGVLKGSGRSIPEIHLKNALDKISDYILGYGGHAGAAGLSISKANLKEFTEKFIEACGTIPERSNDIYYDLELNGNYADVGMELLKYAPYGEGNPKILFHTILDISKGEYKEIGDGSHFMIKMEKNTIMGFGLTQKFKNLNRPQKIECIGNILPNWFNNNLYFKFQLIDFEAAV